MQQALEYVAHHDGTLVNVKNGKDAFDVFIGEQDLVPEQQDLAYNKQVARKEVTNSCWSDLVVSQEPHQMMDLDGTWQATVDCCSFG